MTYNGTVVGLYLIRNIQQITITVIPYLLSTLLFSIISVTACGKKSLHDKYAESEQFSNVSKSEQSQKDISSMQSISVKKLPVPTAVVPKEKDTQIPESITTEEIFVPIGKSIRDSAPIKGVMTADENKITAQTGTRTPNTRIPTNIRFTEERHRSRTVSILN